MAKTKEKDKQDLQTWNTAFRGPGAIESPAAFEAFTIYRDLGTQRTLLKVSEIVNKKYESVRLWSHKYKWADRVNAMNEHKLKEKERLNKEMQRKEIDRINKRLDAKSNVLNVLMQVLINNAENYKNETLELKDFINLLSTIQKIESMNISDLENIKNLETLLKDDSIDTQSINALVNNFNVVLSANNDNAINEYQESLKDDKY